MRRPIDATAGGGSLLTNVFRTRPAVLASVSSSLLSVRTDLQTQRMLMQHAYEIMYRYASAEKVRSESRPWLHVARL